MLASAVVLKRFRLPELTIGRFVAKRTMRSAAFWGIIFCLFVASKAVGYAKAYPSAHDRLALGTSLSNNIGLNAIFGVPHNLATVAGLTIWNTLNAMVIIGAIWALLTATKSLRGEEAAGRWELLLAGQTTARRAALNALAGLAVALLTLFVVAASGFTLVGRVNGVDFSASSSLFFALAVVAGISEFMFVGALASELMPTRAQAASLATAVFGVSFLLRAMADISSAHWISDLSPLGWVEKLQPLYHSQPLWLLPIVGFGVCLAIITVWLAGRRDLGGSVLADHDTARPRTWLLHTPLTTAIRLTRATSLSWLLGISFVAFFFGTLTKSAAQAFSSSLKAEYIIRRLAQAAHAQLTTVAAKTFLGVILLLVMLVIMAYVASALGRVREDEAEGYLDNLLVQPVSRLQWLGGRISLILTMLLLTGVATSMAAWAGQVSQHNNVSFQTFILAGINMLGPAVFSLGLGVLTFGFWPRVTSLVAYGVLAWSFLIQMVSSGVNLNHWLLDTSVLHHIALAPATDPNWQAVLILVGLGMVFGVLGVWRFTKRDIALMQ